VFQIKTVNEYKINKMNKVYKNASFVTNILTFYKLKYNY